MDVAGCNLQAAALCDDMDKVQMGGPMARKGGILLDIGIRQSPMATADTRLKSDPHLIQPFTNN